MSDVYYYYYCYPYDYATDANPHPVEKRMRDEAPVYYNELHRFNALSRFRDVMEASLEAVAGRYLDPLVGSGGFDYLQDFGAKLPVMVISALLGVPEENREQTREWTDALLHRDEDHAESGATQARVSEQLWGCASSLFDAAAKSLTFQAHWG